MSDIPTELAIGHLDGVVPAFAATERLRIHYMQSGPDAGEPVVFIHGNAACSTWWEETMLALPPAFRCIAPDLRGYGLTERAAVIDATRGVQDWVDDLHALLEHLAVDRFHVVGHSLGGMVCWGAMADRRFSGRIRSVTLVAPGPPCGFGGLRGERGEPNNPDFSGSGAGLAHPRLIEFLARHERTVSDPFFSPRAVMHRMFWKPPFRPAREEDFLTAMFQTHLGPDRYPGDSEPSRFWPGFAPGRFGPINAISSKHNQSLTGRVLDSPEKPPLLFIIGADDLAISDTPASDAGLQGRLGFRPGWPGDDVFPPQPMRSQLQFALREYEQRGGNVVQARFEKCGHSPFIEQPRRFHELLLSHLRGT